MRFTRACRPCIFLFMLKTIRKRLKFTQEEVANLLGVDKRTVGNWERSAKVSPLVLKAYRMIAVEEALQ